MNVNVDGYKMIFFLENLLRKFVDNYFSINDLNIKTKEKLEDTATLNGEHNISELKILLNYSHLGDLIDIVKSKKFKLFKNNTTEKVNICPLINHRNNIMHSRPITHSEIQNITKICDNIVNSLDENSLVIEWNKFKLDGINNFEVPKVFIEYPIGKNFDNLIGRNEELKNLKAQLKIPFPVSIVGHGGLGKTALVLQLIEDCVFSPEQPFERIYFMSFKNTVFENGVIKRFEKVISNHQDLINKLASCMQISIEENDFIKLEEKVWEDIFAKKTLLILDNLETQVVQSNLSEFTSIAHRFISNFNKNSRLIITSRFGLGDREAKFPLNQFDSNRTRALIEQHLGQHFVKEKEVKENDWDWIQNFTKGNPGLIITFCNTLRSTRKKILDLRVEFNSKYTTESRELHDQLDEYIGFCFENTIESLNEASQIFLSMICYICSETNLNEVNEEFLTYIREELDLIRLGNHNLRAEILVNIGFLQPIKNTDCYYVNELFINYLDGSYSEGVFNVFSLKKSDWNMKVERLKNHINELQFQEEISLGKLLSELCISKYRSSNDMKYLMQAFFCLPTIENLISYYNRADDVQVINNFSMLDKLGNDLKDPRKVIQQERIITILLNSLLQINKKIIEKKINKIRQTDLYNYFKEMEQRITILKKNNVSNNIRKSAIKLLTILKRYERAEALVNNDVDLVREIFNLYVKQLGDLSGKNSDKCPEYIIKCGEIIQTHPC